MLFQITRKNLNIPNQTINEFIDEINEERPSKRIGGKYKNLFEPYIDLLMTQI